MSILKGGWIDMVQKPVSVASMHSPAVFADF